MSDNGVGERLTRLEIRQEIVIQNVKKLEQKQEKIEEQRSKEHKEIMQLLNQKLDAAAPAKWAMNAQNIVKYIIWLMAILGAAGGINWIVAH